MFEPIAIVGRSCILPGAHSPEALWDAVASGRDLLGPAPADRWGLPPELALTADPHRSADRSWSNRGGYVTGFDFATAIARDPFRHDAKDLLALDPLVHWVLWAGRAALREAGGHDARRTAAILGNLSFPSSAMSAFAEHVWADRPAVDPRNRFMSGLPAQILADELGLGASFALDAACASSLYAIALACDRLRRGELDLALAGAVCRSDDLFIHVGFCALDAMSRSGRSRPFHREADGLVPAEGCALVALERLEDAVARGHKVYGVIRGVGLANDGRGRGLLAPAAEGQARALRAAWDGAGDLDPARLSLVECHATGTPIGDATEIETLAAVFGDRVRDLPVGSLKSNLGHLVTAAGGAALLKVLGAIEHQIRPPSLHADDLNPALAGTPFRVLTAAEPWPSDGPRLAAIDAFGFGGNNAHLLVEEYVPSTPRAARAAAPDPAARRVAVDPEIAVVALAVRVGDGGSTAAFDADLRSGAGRVRPGTPPRAAADEVVLPLDRLKFPPRDLDQSLAQQLLVLDAALDATDRAGAPLPRERTAVLIGAQADPEVCRYGARWRIPAWYPGADEAWVREARDAVIPVLESPGVVGNMPNIPANRISSQLDLGGPAFTLAMEERSGLAAWATAVSMLASGQVDAALVGAVDLSAEVVHERAARAVGIDAPAGDAAVVLVLMRRDQAVAEGRPVLALVGQGTGDDPLLLGPDGVDLRGRFGAAHAATGLVHVAAGVLACAHGYRPASVGPAASWTGDRAASITVRSVFGGEERVWVRAAASEPVRAVEPVPPPARPWRKAAHPEPVEITPPGHARGERIPHAPRLPSVGVAAPLAAPGRGPAFEHMSAAPVLRAVTRAAAPAFTAPLDAPPTSPGWGPPTTTRGAPPPPASLGAGTARRAPAPSPAPSGSVAPPAAAAALAGAPSSASPALVPSLPSVSTVSSVSASTAAAPPAQPGANPALLAHLGALHRQLSAAHLEFLERQQQLHAQFLALRQRSDAALLEAVRQRGASAPVSVSQTAPAPAPAPAAPVRAAPIARPQPAPAPAPAAKAPAPAVSKPSAPNSEPAKAKAQPPTPTSAPKAERAPAPVTLPAAATLPGPKWDRAQLEVLASKRISEVFGAQFAVQDGFSRQVRMPEPPLLLADRVIGLDAVPGSMTTGTIWTETDVTWDAWYLHDGSMPAGVMIEAGQADLLLISWLGADFENRGQRVYRLLGCKLTYGGGLPRPGDTLRYEIHVDGHAKSGATRIFFFHYDCVDTRGVSRLQVREGQAGFFSDAELAESGGILWSPETGEHDRGARLDPPLIARVPRSYDAAQVLAFANGDGFGCFGAGYERLQTHVRTPRMAPPPMSFWQRVTELDPQGGPWKRGYLRAEQDVTPDDWFFAGHFKDDPCMPGTMMFEACLQALGFLIAAYGYTIRRDGWTFEVVPDVEYDLRCRGQVIPSSRDLVYEVFVEEVHNGPWPTVYADVLCTIDGLKAFHARRVGVRLRPDWPMTSRPELQRERIVDPVPVAHTPDGFAFGYHSLLACAWARPSEAFGPMYAKFDDGMHCARLPGPPYHFMSRVTKIDGPIGGMHVGTAIELEYDIPSDEWYFADNNFPTMPFCVLLEAALQPCGWIASYVGSAARADVELYFRNLDGTATWTRELLPTSGMLTTKAKITAISTAGGMIIEGFDVTCLVDGESVYEMKTVFGFFPAASLANQVGITPSDEDRRRLHEPCDFLVTLRPETPARYGAGAPRLPGGKLLMLDRVTGLWPNGGAKGLGRVRSEKDVDNAEWFFKAHFFSDPVQPGSLGLEALIQLLQFWMIHTEQGAGMANPRFEPLMLGRPLTWKYRGQVAPHNKIIRGELDIVEVGTDDRGRYAVADGYLWVDDLRIYQAIGLALRLVDEPTPARADGDPSAASGGTRGAGPVDPVEVLDPAVTPWLRDHPPTWTVPSLPAMSIADRLAAAVAGRGGIPVELRDLTVHRWVTLPGPTRTRVVVGEPRPVSAGVEADATFEVWRDAPDPKLSRFERAATGVVVTAATWFEAPAPLAPLRADEASPVPDPYASGSLFHGPAFRYLTALRIGPTGSSAELDAARGTVPPGSLHQGLLDAVTHAIPHDAMSTWSTEIAPDLAAYPQTIERLTLYGPAPSGKVRVEARFAGMASPRQPRIRVQAIAVDGGRERVWLELVLVEVLLPKGPIGAAPPADRVAFLRDRQPVAGLRLSAVDGDATIADPAVIRATDWLPGTVAAVYGAGPGDDLTRRVAVADHLARLERVHPGVVSEDPPGTARIRALPLSAFPVAVAADGDRVRVTSARPEALDLAPVRAYWDRQFGMGRWPVEDLYYGLMERFVRRVCAPDPDALASVYGRAVVYLGNHQVGVESLLFSILASGLLGASTVTLAKAEHRQTWLGRMIAHNFAYPGVRDPRVITFFDREDKGSLAQIIAELAEGVHTANKSVMVHVEGTRSVECRTPVLKMSGAFVDMAIAVDAPIVPVRFVGGLPAEPVQNRLEFPVGMGRQDIWLGAPINPETLRAMPYKERKELVLAAINGLGPPNAVEAPLPGDPDLEARVTERVARTGAELPLAALLEVLIDRRDRHPAIDRIVDGDRRGALPADPGDPASAWVAELARRLYGPRGARVPSDLRGPG